MIVEDVSYIVVASKQIFSFSFLLQNELTGEHSCIMIKPLSEADSDWLSAYYKGNVTTYVAYHYSRY